MGSDHSLSAAGTGGLKRADALVGRVDDAPVRSMARDMARRTRTSLNGGLSVRT